MSKFILIGQVFEAEKQVAKTGVIHKYCLACNDCHCNLDASSFYNGADGEVVVNFKIHKKFILSTKISLYMPIIQYILLSLLLGILQTLLRKKIRT